MLKIIDWREISGKICLVGCGVVATALIALMHRFVNELLSRIIRFNSRVEI